MRITLTAMNSTTSRLGIVAAAILDRAATTTWTRLPQALCADNRYVDMRRARMALAPGNEREVARFRDACGVTR